MKEDKILQLVREVLAEYGLKVKEDITVNLDQEDNDHFSITIHGIVDNDFEKWCNSLDDDLFVEACEQYEDITGMPLSEENPELFKKVVSDICRQKIDELVAHILKLCAEHYLCGDIHHRYSRYLADVRNSSR